MDGEEFRARAKEVVDYIVEYVKNADSRPCGPQLNCSSPTGYAADLREFIPPTPPTTQSSYKEVLKDLDTHIVPRLLGWDSPNFFAYFPAGNAYPTILGDMLSAAYNNIGFSWVSSPAMTELEMIMMDWWGQILNSPKQYLFQAHGSRGGGVIQSSASEAIFITIVAARQRALDFLKKKNPGKDEFELINRLVSYTNKESHSCVQKGAKLANVRMRILKPNRKNKLTKETLEQAIEEDVKAGLVPFLLSCIVGTTGTTAYDNLMELGAVCKRYPLMWMHVDCAYAGSAFMCPEFQYLCAGLDYADSWNVNANKWMTTCFDCSGHWVKDRFQFTKGLVITPVYLKAELAGIIDYRHWHTALSRRFRSLKLYGLFRVTGAKMLREYIRNHVKLAKLFEELILTDKRFEITSEVHLGLVCTRLIGPDLLTQHLVAFINALGKIHVTPTKDQAKYVMRLAVTYEFATKDHILFAWKHIQECATEVLQMSREYPNLMPSRRLCFAAPVDQMTLKDLDLITRDIADPIPVHEITWNVLND